MNHGNIFSFRSFSTTNKCAKWSLVGRTGKWGLGFVGHHSTIGEPLSIQFPHGTFTTFFYKGRSKHVHREYGHRLGGLTSRALISAMGSLNILYWHHAGAYEARFSRDSQNVLVTIVFSQILCHVNVEADRWGFILPSLGEIIGLQACNKSI